MTLQTGSSQPLPVFSPRLDEVLDQVTAGKAPNAGRFCGYCYTPLAQDRTECPHCGRSTADWPPEPYVPDEVILMYQELRRRERAVVHSFTYLALALTVVLTLAAAWFLPGAWKALSLVVLVVCYFGLVTLLAGVVGDRLGYAAGQRTLARRWEAFARDRDGASA